MASSGENSSAPISFLYEHFHNAIRAELQSVSALVLALDSSPASSISSRLQDLRERYRFLEQIYKYHSSVEDEVCCVVLCTCMGQGLYAIAGKAQVVYPALEGKVKNVTRAYSVEHEDEVG